MLNRPGCYWGCYGGDDQCGFYTALTSWETVKSVLERLYPGILVDFLGVQLVICAALLAWNYKAVQVYFQDDAPEGVATEDRPGGMCELCRPDRAGNGTAEVPQEMNGAVDGIRIL